MHLYRIPALPVALLTLLLPGPSFMVAGQLSSERSICVRQNALLLAEAAACGNRSALRDCFLNAPPFVTRKDLERCFIDADCTIAEANTEGMAVAKTCDSSANSPELRRRDPNAMPEPTPAPQDAKPTSPAPATTSAAAAAFSTPTECSTERHKSTTVCPFSSLGPNSFTRLPCTPTVVTDLVCAATNVCLEDGLCVFRDDHLTASGLVATILLAAAFVVTFGAVLVFWVREKRDLRKKRLVAERRKIEHESLLHAQKRSDSSGGGGGGSGSGSAQQGGAEEPYDPHNPFVDGH
ncbi:hypothetical protein F5Y17DRAFT_169013 [Xylariaceae sp. FL0594]|nr:hypothetical protein F5Y17DRAFT_169013 [Xylariaceae sp. FL0594]